MESTPPSQSFLKDRAAAVGEQRGGHIDGINQLGVGLLPVIMFQILDNEVVESGLAHRNAVVEAFDFEQPEEPFDELIVIER
jgi:hypothetical protein